MELPHRIYHGPEVERLYRDLLAARITADALADDVPAGGDLSGTYPNPTVAKLQGRAVNSSAPTIGNALVWNGSDWAPGASSGVGGIQTWFPDAPPTSVHSADDEMDGGSIDAKWTENDPSSSVVWDVDTTKHMYRAVQTGDGTVRWSMLYQAVPDSEFAIYTKCDSITEQGASGVGIGLFVSDDLANNPTTADFRTVELVHVSFSPFRYVLSRTWSAYNGTASALSSSVVMGHYLRIRCDGTAFKADVSVDGVGWYRVSTVTLGFTPTHCGICFTNVDSAVEATGLFTFYRTQSGAGTSGYNSTYIGRYV